MTELHIAHQRDAMRVLVAVLTTFILCSACAMAAGLPSDLPTAENLATKQGIEHGGYYERLLQPFFYENVLNQCVQQSFDDRTPFSLVIAIDATGKASKTYWGTQTLVGKCLEPVISKTAFPKPPVSPFFAHFDISFERRR
jgi:hypothetical protein